MRLLQIDRVRTAVRVIESRQNEDLNRPLLVDRLRSTIENTKTILSKVVDDSIAEVVEINASLEAQECWLAEKLALQNERSLAEEPALSCDMLLAAVQTVSKLAAMLNK